MDHLGKWLKLAPNKAAVELLHELMQANKSADPTVKPFIDSRPEAERHMTVEECMAKIGVSDLLADVCRSVSDDIDRELARMITPQHALYWMGEFATSPIISVNGMEQTVYKITAFKPPTILQRFRMMTDDEVVRFIRELSIVLYETEYDLTNLWCSGNCPDEGDGCSDDRRDACIRQWLNLPYKGGEIIGLT